MQELFKKKFEKKINNLEFSSSGATAYPSRRLIVKLSSRRSAGAFTNRKARTSAK